MRWKSTQQLPEFIHLDHGLSATEHITIDGIEYTRAQGLAHALGRTPSYISKYKDMGLPNVRTNQKAIILYPIEECRKWIQYNISSIQGIKKIDLNGELCFSSTGLAEYFGCTTVTVGIWRKKGMPAVSFRNMFFYPFQRCEAWLHENDCIKESKCNYCDNAYADRCSWFIDYTPVPGWTAIELPYSEKGPTYNVRKCPNFIPDQSNERRKEAWERLMKHRK